jgi:hypothetical protein
MIESTHTFYTGSNDTASVDFVFTYTCSADDAGQGETMADMEKELCSKCSKYLHGLRVVSGWIWHPVFEMYVFVIFYLFSNKDWIMIISHNDTKPLGFWSGFV